MTDMITKAELLAMCERALNSGIYDDEYIRPIAAELKLRLTEPSEREKALEAAVVAMAEDGWLACGPEGMSAAQEVCYTAYLTVKPPVEPEKEEAK